MKNIYVIEANIVTIMLPSDSRSEEDDDQPRARRARCRFIDDAAVECDNESE